MRRIQRHLSQVPPPNRGDGAPDERPRLYHYTDFAGLVGITKSREFWLSDIHHLNDITELKDALDELRTILYPFIQNHDPSQQLMEEILNTAENFSEWGLFIGSFSEDHDVLSQWRAYCADGGVSIGFVFEDLKKLAKENGFRLIKCIYSTGTKNDLLNELLKNPVRDFKSGKPLSECVESFITQYQMLTPSFKHFSFAEEREWRIIPDPQSYLERAFVAKLSRYDVRVAGNMLVPYYRLPLSELGLKKEKFYLGFDNIFVGPHYQTEKLIGTVSHLFNCQRVYWRSVSHSDSPYRKTG